MPDVAGVKVELQVADAVVPARVHVVNDDPMTPFCERFTVPVGVTKVPVPVSVTVTEQVELWLITTGLVQLTVVDVVRSGTVVIVMIDVPLLLV